MVQRTGLWQGISIIGVVLLGGAALMWNTTNIDLQAVQSLHQKYAAHAELQVLDDKISKLEHAGEVRADQASLVERLSKENDALQQRLLALEGRIGLPNTAPSPAESRPAPSPTELIASTPTEAAGQYEDQRGSPAENSEVSAPAPGPANNATVEKNASAVKNATKKKEKAQAKFRGHSEPRLNWLQKWFRQELWKSYPEWSEKMRKLEAASLEMLWTPTANNGTVEWMLTEGCGKKNQLATCKGICAHQGLVCSKKELDAATTQRSLKRAAMVAGSACGYFKEHPNAGTWDGPWINGATCGFATGRSFGDCTKSANCGFKRLCPCTGISTENAGKMPSAKRQRMMRWHQRWDHQCNGSTEAVLNGKPKIPRHFHFTLVEERGDWINKSYPFELITSAHPLYRRLTQEEQLLVENMRHALVINEAFSVHFLDHMACISATQQISQELLRLYLAESDLRYKSDVCRVAALYLEGGYYLDDDMLSYRPVVPLIHDDTDIATAISLSKTEYFQSFLAAAPCHPVLRRNADLLVQAKQPNMPKRLDGLLGPRTLKVSFDDVKPKHSQLFQETGYFPDGVNYERIPERNGHQCGLVVYDPATKKTPFCSRF